MYTKAYFPTQSDSRGKNPQIKIDKIKRFTIDLKEMKINQDSLNNKH